MFLTSYGKSFFFYLLTTYFLLQFRLFFRADQRSRGSDNSVNKTAIIQITGTKVHFTYSNYNLIVYYGGLFEFKTGVMYPICDFFFHCTRKLFMVQFWNFRNVLYPSVNTYMRRLTTGIRSEKCVVRRFRRCANFIQCTYTNLDSTVQPTAHTGYMVQPIATRLQTCTACYCIEYCRQL